MSIKHGSMGIGEGLSLSLSLSLSRSFLFFFFSLYLSNNYLLLPIEIYRSIFLNIISNPRFNALIEKEWLSFGHRFSLHGRQTNEKEDNFAPIFLQVLFSYAVSVQHCCLQVRDTRESEVVFLV